MFLLQLCLQLLEVFLMMILLHWFVILMKVLHLILSALIIMYELIVISMNEWQLLLLKAWNPKSMFPLMSDRLPFPLNSIYKDFNRVQEISLCTLLTMIFKYPPL